MEDSVTRSPIITLMQIYNKKEQVGQRKYKTWFTEKKSTWKYNAGAQYYAKRDKKTEERHDVY